MFDLGVAEILVIGTVALIVVGPKDLPKMFHKIGLFSARMRRLAQEFSSAMESAAKETGVKDVADDLKSAASLKNMGLDHINDMKDTMKSWEAPSILDLSQKKNTSKSTDSVKAKKTSPQKVDSAKVASTPKKVKKKTPAKGEEGAQKVSTSTPKAPKKTQSAQTLSKAPTSAPKPKKTTVRKPALKTHLKKTDTTDKADL